MESHWRKSVVTILLLLLATEFAYAQPDCVFAAKDLNESKFKNDKRISKYTWNKSAREAKVVTKDGSLISAKYWTCDHYGAHAVMLMGPYPELNAIGKKFMQLAEITLAAHEAKTVRNYLQKNSVTLTGETAQLDIPDTGYPEFYLRYRVVYDSLVLEIKFYKD